MFETIDTHPIIKKILIILGEQNIPISLAKEILNNTIKELDYTKLTIPDNWKGDNNGI